MIDYAELIPSKDVRAYMEKRGRVLTDFEKAALIYNHSEMSYSKKATQLKELMELTEDSNLKEEIAKQDELKKYFSISAMGIEGLFMEWIVRALKQGGKAFVVVPDGIMNRSNDKKLRDFILEKCNIETYENVVMIGDRKYDIEGAKQAGLDSIGVLFGYGDHKELAEAGATYIVEKPEDILNVLCHNF